MRKRKEKEEKRALHEAIRAVQGKPLAVQRAWLEQHPNELGPSEVLGYLHPELQIEIIRDAERRACDASAGRRPKKRRRRHGAVEAMLRGLLGRRGHRVAAADILARAREAGSERSLYRAKKKLGIRSTREGFGRGSRCFWFLP